MTVVTFCTEVWVCELNRQPSHLCNCVPAYRKQYKALMGMSWMSLGEKPLCHTYLQQQQRTPQALGAQRKN